jgi:hypothetical protein
VNLYIQCSGTSNDPTPGRLDPWILKHGYTVLAERLLKNQLPLCKLAKASKEAVGIMFWMPFGMRDDGELDLFAHEKPENAALVNDYNAASKMLTDAGAWVISYLGIGQGNEKVDYTESRYDSLKQFISTMPAKSICIDSAAYWTNQFAPDVIFTKRHYGSVLAEGEPAEHWNGKARVVLAANHAHIHKFGTMKAAFKAIIMNTVGEHAFAQARAYKRIGIEPFIPHWMVTPAALAEWRAA